MEWASIEQQQHLEKKASDEQPFALSCVVFHFDVHGTYILIRSAMHAYTHQHRYMTTNANVMQRTYLNAKKKSEENVEHFRRKMHWHVLGGVCLRERKTEVNKCILYTRTCPLHTAARRKRQNGVAVAVAKAYLRTRIKYAVNVL